MNKQWRWVVSMVLATTYACSGWADVYSRSGVLGIGTRPMGMGGAFVAVAEGPSAFYWNPAGLVQMSRIEFSTMLGSLKATRAVIAISPASCHA